MIRKFALALAATVAIGATALTPTAASAHPHHNHWRGSVGIYAPTTYVDNDCYTVKRVVDTWNGPRVRRYTVCD
jgi:hypothetical protein